MTVAVKEAVIWHTVRRESLPASVLAWLAAALALIKSELGTMETYYTQLQEHIKKLVPDLTLTREHCS